MSATVSEALLEPTRRPVAVAALTEVIDAEVADKSGLGGAAVKAGYAAVKKLRGDFVTTATDRLLPQFASALDPFWATKEDQPFGAHLASQSDAAADALLAVTDGRAARTSNAAAAKVYGSLRGRAKSHVVATRIIAGTLATDIGVKRGVIILRTSPLWAEDFRSDVFPTV